jgi:hypothetical protein
MPPPICIGVSHVSEQLISREFLLNSRFVIVGDLEAPWRFRRLLETDDIMPGVQCLTFLQLLSPSPVNPDWWVAELVNRTSGTDHEVIAAIPRKLRTAIDVVDLAHALTVGR